MFGEPISYGGQESVVYNMLSVFDLKKEFHVDLYTPYFADNRNIIDLVEKNNGRVYTSKVEFKTGDNRFKLTNIVDDFLVLHHDYDVVHIHTGSLTTMVVYAKLAKKYNIKKVIVHSHITNQNQGLMFKIRRFVLCMMLKPYADVFMGCSREAIDAKFKPIAKESIVVNNGIDVDRFKFNENFRKEFRDKYNICDKYVVGSLGRISHQKNNKFMVDIVVRLVKDGNRDIILFMVGGGEDLSSIKEYAKECGVSDYIIFAGNQTETYKYYSAFDIFILSSLFEGLPVTSIEAQISGLPVLISKNVDNECNISKMAEFLDITDVNIWCDKIIELKNNYRNKRNAVIDFDKFDRRLTFKVVEKIYKDTM